MDAEPSQRTLVLLDFDWVVSPVAVDGLHRLWELPIANPDHEWVEFRSMGFTVHIRKEVIKFVNALAAHPLVDLYWLTSWDSFTEDFPSDSGGELPAIPYLPVQLTHDKSASMLALLETGSWSKVLLLEDYQSVVRRHRKALRTHRVARPSTPKLAARYITPPIHWGLSDFEIGQAWQFIHSKRRA
ncbi:hypothetical protein V5R04_07050 [Jonesiaceae bacterium BS-20]|uniref:Magnesium-dependent phosphatase-1 n=1 Tax=Jonesiaceae bacterium BS-20 TaxID=3120821 RepID=A0AAU7DZL1_9MICO